MNEVPSNLKAHWSEIHSKKFQDVSWWQSTDDLWFDLIDIAGTTSSSLIDVGSGASLLVDEAIRRGFTDVNVLDISDEAISRVRERLSSSKDKVHFYVADVRFFDSERTFDIWHDRAVFHFLTSESDQQLYKSSLLKNLSPSGSFVISTFAPTGPESCSGLNVVRHDAASLLSIFGSDFELVYSDQRTHSTPWDSSQLFTSVVFKRKNA